MRKEAKRMSEIGLLSPSACRKGLLCPKILWLEHNQPHQEIPDVMQEVLLRQKAEVKHLGQSMFKEYAMAGHDSPQKAAEQTAALLLRETAVIADAVFVTNGCFCRVDIVMRNADGSLELYLFKCASSVREIYFQDAAYQYWAVSECGYRIKNMYIVYLNRHYVKEGELDLNRLFVRESVIKTARKRAKTMPEQIKTIKDCLNEPAEPEREIDACCFSPYRCRYTPHCLAFLPSPNVFDLGSTQLETKLNWYRSGIISFSDLARQNNLSQRQRMQVECGLDPKKKYIDREGIRRFLEQFVFPMYFLDFESFQPAVPRYDHTRPFQQIVFQYSLHYRLSEDGSLMHREFLAGQGYDPRREAAEHLCWDIPDEGCVVVYNEAYEKQRIRELAELFPDLREHLMGIYDRIIDLIVPFQKRMYYTAGMNGSHSIKHVLPALYASDPTLSYEQLDGVHEGAEAAAVFAAMDDMEEEELEKNRANLLRYCRLDTLAMVRIYEKLKEAVQ